MLAKALRSVAAVGHRPMVNLLEQLPQWYTLVVAWTPFRGTIVVALVGATVIHEGYIKREVCPSAKSGDRHGFSHGSSSPAPTAWTPAPGLLPTRNGPRTTQSLVLAVMSMKSTATSKIYCRGTSHRTFPTTEAGGMVSDLGLTARARYESSYTLFVLCPSH